MDNNTTPNAELDTTNDKVELILMEQPTAGDVAKQAIVGTAVSLIGTALVYGAVLGVVAGVNKIQEVRSTRRLKKAMKRQEAEAATEATTAE